MFPSSLSMDRIYVPKKDLLEGATGPHDKKTNSGSALMMKCYQLGFGGIECYNPVPRLAVRSRSEERSVTRL